MRGRIRGKMRLNKIYLYFVVVIGGWTIGSYTGTFIVNILQKIFKFNLEGGWWWLIFVIIISIVFIWTSISSLREELEENK